MCVYPHREIGDWGHPVFRELKVLADLGYKCNIRLNDFTCPREVSLTMRDSNVVVCAIGASYKRDEEQDYENSNILVPWNIAKCVANTKGVKWFIYISHVGADPNSPSQNLRTKWVGE